MDNSFKIRSEARAIFLVPKTRVYVNAWEIHKDHKIWERPEEFLAERLVDSLNDFKGQHYQYKESLLGFVTVEDADSAFEFSMNFVRGLILTKTDKATHIQNKCQDYKTTY